MQASKIQKDNGTMGGKGIDESIYTVVHPGDLSGATKALC